MKKLFRRYANRYFLTITISAFLPLVILSFVILAASFSVYNYEAKKRNIESIHQKLSSYADQTGLKYRRTKYVANQLSMNYNLMNWIYSNDKELDLYKLWEIQRDLNSIITSNSGIFSIDIYKKRDNTFMSTYSGFWSGDNREKFTAANSPAFLSMNEVSSQICIYNINTTPGNKTTPALALVHPLPFNGKLGTVSINMQLNIFTDYDVSPTEFLFITDPDDTFIYSSSAGLSNGISGDDILYALSAGVKTGGTNKIKVGSTSYNVLYKPIFDDYFKLVYLTPEPPAVHSRKELTNYFIATLVIILFVSFAFSLFIYRIARRPLKQIVDNIRNFMIAPANEIPHQDEINYLSSSINSLINKNNEVERILESYKGTFIENTLRDLIFGRKIDEASLAHNTLELFRENNNNFIVIVLNMDKIPSNSNEAFIDKFFVSVFDTLQKQYTGYYLRTGLKNYTFAASLDSSEHVPGFLELLKQIQGSSLTQYEVELSIGVSRIKLNKEELSTAYNEAVEALKRKVTLGNGQIIVYQWKGYTEELKSSYFPVEEGQMLISKLRTASEKEVTETLSKIIDIKADTYCIELLHAFLLYIASCIAKVATEYNIRLDDISNNNIFELINNFETIEEKKSFLVKQCSKIIEVRNNEQKQLKKMSVEIVVQYIMNKFHQPLSLTNIADDLHISTSYLSNLIKKELGVSFLTYITNLRMAKAVELLKDRHLAIKEIACRVGFDSEHSFIRNFKKVYGRTPSEYRNHIYREVSGKLS